MPAKMNAKDAIYGAEAECYVTIDGNRYNMMSMVEFSCQLEFNIVDVPILGQVNKGHKTAGTSGTWTGTAHFNQSFMRKWAYNYQKTGKLVPFDIQVSNEDPSSSVGRQTILLRRCLLDTLILAMFNADEETLDEELSGTFEDWEMPEEFTLLPGMQ
jgi:hypothetical protein